MSEYQAQIVWHRQATENFLDAKYSRCHLWKFDGGVVVPASSAVQSVPLPYSKPENVDPEEALVAAVSSCHMLFFLSLAAKAGLVVDCYHDLAKGTMSKNDQGRVAITSVLLSPDIVFSGAEVATDSIVGQLHHAAHDACYIANSLRAEITVAGAWRQTAIVPL